MTDEEARNRLCELAAALGGPPPGLEVKLRSRYRAARRRPWQWAAAAALAAGLGWGAWLGTSQPAEPEETSSGFVMLDYGRPTPELVPGRLVRVTLPPTAPAWFGLPVDPGARERIEAEVLLGDDGVAQAVRLVRER